MQGVYSFYCPQGGLVKRDLTQEQIAAAIRDERALLWVDIEADGRDDAESLLRDVFGFHQLTIDDCYNTLIDPPKVDDYGDYLYVIVHDVQYDAENQRLWTAELNLYVGANY